MTPRMTLAEAQLRTITETQWQERVIDIAQLRGWLWYHAPDNRPITSKSGRKYVQDIRAGFPDLVLVRARRIIFAELKRETGQPTQAQTDWLHAVCNASCEAYLWRPSDQPEVEKVLR